MLEMPWLKSHLPGGLLEGGVSKANELYWNLSMVESEHGYFVLGGEVVILKTDSREVVDAFLL